MAQLGQALAEQAYGLAAIERILVRDPDLREALRASDVERLLAAYGPVYAQLKANSRVTHFCFSDPGRVCLLRVHKPEKFGDRLDRLTAMEAERTGTTASGLDLGPLGTFTLRVVHPVTDKGARIGYLELGKEIEDVLARTHQDPNVEVAVVLHKDAVKRTNWEEGMRMLGREPDWGRFVDDVLVYSSLSPLPSVFNPIISEEDQTQGIPSGEVRFDDRAWRVMTHLLSDASGAQVGHLILLHDVSSINAEHRHLVWSAAGVTALLLTVLLVFLFLLLRRTDRGIRSQQEALVTAKDAAEAANRAKSTFLANMSHEIRTPLNAIIGFSQLMQGDADLSQKNREHLDTINRSGEHLLALINDILEMSKIEAGRTVLASSTFDLHALVSDLEVMFRVRTDEKGLQFELNRGEDVPRYVAADEGKLRQVLINLLSNAVKFTDTGGVTARVTSTEGRDDGPLVSFSVTDTGPGIAEEEQHRLFKHFEQTASGVGTGAGTGLGLAISREFVRLMGGDLTIESQPGVGSTFRFEVAMEVGDAADAPEEGLARQVTGLKPGQPERRILVVDDKQPNRRLVREMLAGVGFTVYEATNGREAVESFAEHACHLILMDRRMPVMDGFGAIARIRETAEGKNVVIIVLTASAFQESREASLVAGADDFIAKPFRAEDLFAAIGKHLGVEYEYAEAEPAAGETAEGSSQPTVGAVAELPANLLKRMRDATISGDLDRLLELIDEAEGHDATAAEGLRRLADQFEYEALLQVLGTEDTVG